MRQGLIMYLEVFPLLVTRNGGYRDILALRRMTFLGVLVLGFLPQTSKAQVTAEWDSIKRNTQVQVAPSVQAEYGEPYQQPLSTMGWEDGLHITPDGKHLYAIYAPYDLFSYTQFINAHPDSSICYRFSNFGPYVRDTAYGVDTVTNIFGCPSWTNVDILKAERTTVQDSFQTWQLSGLSRPFYPDGGPFPLMAPNSDSLVDLFAFTGDKDIWMVRDTDLNPEGDSAERLCYPINPPVDNFDTVYCDTSYAPADINADNPTLYRIDQDSVVLFLDSERPGGQGYIDIWYALSGDNGRTWSDPVNVTSINTTNKEHQPMPWEDPQTGKLYLYYAVGCEIYRSEQLQPGDWDSWGAKQKLLSPGNAECIGEPSLTRQGDISFVVVYKNTVNNDSTDTYDADPWFLPKEQVTSVDKRTSVIREVRLYPNPSSGDARIDLEADRQGTCRVSLLDLTGRVLWEKEQAMVRGKNTLSLSKEQWTPGQYLVRVRAEGERLVRKWTVLHR